MKQTTLYHIFIITTLLLLQGCLSEVKVNMDTNLEEDKTDPSKKDKEEVIEKNKATGLDSGMVAAINLYAVGNHLYAYNNSDANLHFIDTSTPSNLKHKKTVVLDSKIHDVHEFSNYLFVTTANAGLKVIDISNFSDPLLVNESSLSTYDVKKIHREGNTLYISSSEDGILLVNISNPATPTFISQYKPSSGKIYDSLKIGNYLYLANGSNGLHVINLSTPSSLSLVTTLIPSSGTGAYNELENSGSTIVAGGYSDLDVIDVSTPSTPSISSTLDFSGLYGDGYFEFHNNILYFNIAERGVIYYDLTNPMAPNNLGAHNTQGYTYGLSHSGTHLYVADQTGVAVFDTSDLIGVELISKTPLPSTTSLEFVKQGNFIYMITLAKNLEIIDVSNPSTPIARGSVGFSGTPKNIAVSGNYAYVTNHISYLDIKVEIIDISDPDNPLNLGAFTPLVSQEEAALKIKDGYLYTIRAGLTPNELLIYDIVTTPGTPILISSTPLNAFSSSVYTTGLVVKSNSVFVIHDWEGIEVYDSSDKTSLSHIPTTGVNSWANYALEAFESENYVAVKEDYTGLSIANISNPTTPYIVNNISTWWGYHLGFSVQGNYLFITGVKSGLEILDMSNEYTAIELGGYNAYPEDLKGIIVEGNLLYTSSSLNLYIFDITDKVGIELISYYNEIFSSTINSVTLNQYEIELDAFGDLLIFDTTSEDKSPIFRKRFANGSVKQLSLLGNYIQVGEENGLVTTFDLSDITSPQMISRDFKFRDMCVEKFTEISNFAFCKGGNNGLIIYDITNINNPTYVSTEDTNYTFYFHNNVFFSTFPTTGVYYYDVSNPYNIVKTTLYLAGSSNFHSVRPYKDYFYISKGTDGFTILDISDPLNTIELATLTGTVDFRQILYSNDDIVIVYDSSSSQKLAVVDVRNPTSPVVTQTLDLGYSARGINEVDGEIIMSTYGNDKTITINPDMTINVN